MVLNKISKRFDKSKKKERANQEARETRKDLHNGSIVKRSAIASPLWWENSFSTLTNPTTRANDSKRPSSLEAFIMNVIIGSLIGNPLEGGLDKLTGDNEGDGGDKTESGEDPEVVAARLEQEERRKEKHRKMEREREKMRQDIRTKYNISKKENGVPFDISESRIGSTRKKTPEELAREMSGEDDSIIGQLGLTEQVEKAKTAVSGAFETVKGFLPFGK